MWVHFHNETKVRDYATEDWDELITLIESDIGLDRGVEKITFKAAKTGEECEVDPDLFDEILNSPKGPTPGVFNVYFAVRRLVKVKGEKEPREVFCTDFDHFVQQLEEQAGASVKRITYTAKGPNGRPIEFEVGEDTFTELPGLVFNAYFDDGQEDDEDEEPKAEPVYTIQTPDLPHPVVVRGDLVWADFLTCLADMNPKGRVDKVTARYEKGKEVPVTPQSFDVLDADAVTFHVQYAPPQEVSVAVHLPGLAAPQPMAVASYHDLVHQIEQIAAKPVLSLSFEAPTGPTEEDARGVVDDATLDRAAATPDAVFKPKLGPGTIPRRTRVLAQLPGDRYPSFVCATDAGDLQAQLAAVLRPQDGDVTAILAPAPSGPPVELDGDIFAALAFPHPPLVVRTHEPNIRRVQLDWEDKPRRVFCKTLEQLRSTINDLLPEGKTVSEIACTIKGPHGQELVQEVDDATFQDAAEDASMVFRVKAGGTAVLTVTLPDDGEVRTYKAKTYGELVRLIETDTALLVSQLTAVVEADGGRAEAVLTEETFEEQIATSTRLRVYFKEVPAIKVQLEDAAEPATLSVSTFEDLLLQVRKLAGQRDVVTLTYAVRGPKGQRVDTELTADSWEELAADPADTVVAVALGPIPKQYSVEFPEGSVTVCASDFDDLQRQIRRQAGGRRVSTVLVEQASSSSELTPAGLAKLEGGAASASGGGAALKVVLAPVAEGTWLTINVKFPFEKTLRRIEGCGYEGVVQAINKEAPEGFLDLEKLTYYPEGAEVDVDERNFREAKECGVTFYAHFKPDPKYPLPARNVVVEGTDQKYPVYAATFKDFMEVVEELAAGRPIVHLGPAPEGSEGGGGEDDDISKAFYDLPRDASFRLTLAKGSQAAGARVKFPHSMDEILLEAHTFDRLMHLIKAEARDEGYKVTKVTYIIEGPTGQKIEMDDFDEDVFENLEDLDHVVFKVHYEGQQKGAKLVLYPEDDRPHQVLAETYAEFLEAILEENPDKPSIEHILYEVPAPKGGTVSFTLTEEGWDDIADEPNTVFKVIFPLPTTELMVRFPWDDAPRPLPAGSFEELQESIAKALPADQKVARLTYAVEGPSGHKLEFPLDEAAFDDIEDADTVIKVHTTKARALYVHYPAAPIACQPDLPSFLAAVQAGATPGKKVGRVHVTFPGAAEAPLDPAAYLRLQETDDANLRVEYE